MMREIVGFEGVYSVTSNGKVWAHSRIIKSGYHYSSLRREKGIFLSPKVDFAGYLLVCLAKSGKGKMFRVHRLVAQAFIPNPNNLPQVNHKNGVKIDNRIDNLEWCTAQYNSQHSAKNALLPLGMKSKTSKLTDKQVRKIRRLGAEKRLAHREIGNLFGINQSTASNIIRRTSWKHLN